MLFIDKFKKLLKTPHYGFTGVTHWLIATALFLCMWIVPWPFAKEYILTINKNKIFAVLIFFVIGGASLLPDLDSSPLQEGGSLAVYQLGIVGYLLSLVAITISGVIYTIFHTKYDDKPKSQHRMFWHTLLVPILLFIYVEYYIPKEGSYLWNYRTNVEYYSMFILVFFAAISIYLGSGMFFSRLFKLFNQQSKTQFVCLIITILSTIYIFTTEYENLVLIGKAIALGYAFHIFGDVLTKGSSPILFPIPTFKNKKLIFWRKPYLFGPNLAITTGSIVNTILNFVLIAINLFFVWIIFIK